MVFLKVLIVDDEIHIQEVIKEYCLAEGYLVDTAFDGSEALEKLNSNYYDILILDIMMPEMDGFSMLKQLSVKRKIPTIVLSARSDIYDKLEGFELGIDDYVVKPFSPKELMARIKAVLKRSENKLKQIYVLDGLEVNFSAHTIKINQKKVEVTPKEFEILTYLIENKNIAISREQLLSKLWGYDFFGDDRTIDTHIKMLRNNLGEYRDYIETVRGVGYKFVDEKED